VEAATKKKEVADLRAKEAITDALAKENAATDAEVNIKKASDQDRAATKEAKRLMEEADAELVQATSQRDMKQAQADLDYAEVEAGLREKQALLFKSISGNSE
jgi:hypothetical protein